MFNEIFYVSKEMTLMKEITSKWNQLQQVHIGQEPCKSSIHVTDSILNLLTRKIKCQHNGRNITKVWSQLFPLPYHYPNLVICGLN